jgi:hypothetical protein
MSVDLRSYKTFERYSILVMEDCVVKLEHTYGDDRIRRIKFDTLERMIIFRKTPWLRVIIGGLLMLVGLLTMLNNDLLILGVALAVVGLAVVIYYLYCGATTIRMVRRGIATDLDGIFRPGKVRKFREKVLDGVRRAQTASPAA